MCLYHIYLPPDSHNTLTTAILFVQYKHFTNKINNTFNTLVVILFKPTILSGRYNEKKAYYEGYPVSDSSWGGR